MAEAKKKKNNAKKSTNSKNSIKKKTNAKVVSTSKKTTSTKNSKSNNTKKNTKTSTTKKKAVNKTVKPEIKEIEEKNVEIKEKVEESKKEKITIDKKNAKKEKRAAKKEARLKKKEEKKQKHQSKQTQKLGKNAKKEKTKKIKKEKEAFKFSTVYAKFKKLPMLNKCFIVVSIVCGVLLIIEGILVLEHKGYIERNTVYHESFSGVAIDDSYVVVVGSTDVKHSGLTKSKGNERGKLIKYDGNGNIVFEKTYKKGISTTFTSVITLPDGYLVTGTGIFSKEEQDNEGKEAVLIKYTRDGDIVWEKFYQVITDTSFNKAILVSDGYVVVGQSIYANMEMGNHTTGGGIIVKYDFNGEEVWHNNHGGTKSGNFNDIVEIDGNYYVVGKDGSDSANLVKFNSKGEYVWHKNYSYTDNAGFEAIAFENNLLYVVGSKKILPDGIGEEDSRNTTNTDALLVVYDLDGTIKFEKTYGGSSYERFNDIIAFHNNFYVIGHLCSKDAGLKVTTDSEDEMTGFIIRYDINGNILRKDVLGGSNNDNLMAIDTDGISYYVVGYSNSSDGNIEGSHSNGKDYYGKIIKLNSKFKRIFVK